MRRRVGRRPAGHPGGGGTSPLGGDGARSLVGSADAGPPAASTTSPGRLPRPKGLATAGGSVFGEAGRQMATFSHA